MSNTGNCGNPNQIFYYQKAISVKDPILKREHKFYIVVLFAKFAKLSLMKCSSASVKGVSLPTCCFVWKVQKVLVALGCNFWMKKIWDKIEMHHAPRDGLKIGFGPKSGPTHFYPT